MRLQLRIIGSQMEGCEGVKTHETGSDFTSEKARALSKVDLSKKGSVDEPIADLIGYLNSLEDFYTTSSCSGRLCVLQEVGSLSNSYTCTLPSRWEEIQDYMHVFKHLYHWSVTWQYFQ